MYRLVNYFPPAGVTYLNAGNSLPAYTLTVTDEASNTATATQTPTISLQNDAPTISQTTANNFTEDSTSSGATVGVFDVDDEETADGSLTVTVSDTTNYAISYDNSGTATVTLTDAGAARVNAGNELPAYTVTVTDGNSSTATATHDPSVTTVNDAPTISQTTANNFTEDSTSSGATVGVFDVDDEETADGSLTVTVSDTTNYAISYDNSGTATVTLTDAGAARVNAGNELPAYTVTVTDGDSSTATATHDPSVTTVNDDPTIAVSATSTLTEGSVSAGDTVHTFNIADEETADDTLTLTLSNTTYYAVANNDNGTATVTLTAAGVTYLNAGNSLPAYTLTVTDEASNTATATQTPTISLQNDAPTISQTTANNFTEDSTSSGATVGVFDVDDEETADGSLTVTVSDTTNYAISYDNSGTATVTLTDAGAARVNAGNELPAYTVTVTDGDSSTATATHDPSVTTVNDAPTISQTTANNFTEDSTSSGATVGVFDVDDEETADGSLTVTVSDTTNYAISYDNSGTATVTLTDAGAARVNAGNELPAYTVTVTDGNSSTATATHDPSVTTVNDDPTIAVSATSTLTEGSVSAGDTVHTFNIADEETADDTLTLTLSNTTYYAVANNDNGTATVTLTAAGVTYLNAGNSLPAYTLTVTDEASNTATATQTPTISLQNDAPTISQTTANNFTEDSTSSGATVGVFDVDDEETADGSLTVTVSDTTNYAISYDNSGTATVTLTDAGAARVNAGNELPAYTVTVTDGDSSTATATHDPSVTTVNDAPTISQTTANNFTEDSTSSGATVGVFDVDDEETADGSLTVTVSDTTNYAISYDNSGTATVTLTDAGAARVNAGNELPAYTVTVTDGDSSTATATHDPSVTTVNDDPTIAVSATSTLTEGSVSAGDTVHTFNIADEETADDTLTLTLSNTTYYAVANNDNGTATVTLTAAGVTYLNAGNSLPAYTLTVTDEASNTATATQTPTISLQNDAPTISQTTANNFTEDSTSSGATVGVFDVDDEETADGSLTVTVSDTTNYAISYDNSGTATVTLTDAGAARVNAGNELPAYTVTVTDGDSSTATATHDPSVTTVNDDPTIAVSATSTLTEGSVSAGDTVHTFNIADEETADDTLTLTLSNTTYYAVANNDNGTATVTLTAAGVTYLNAGNSLPAYTLTVTDEASNTATATQTPTISLQNDAPTISQTTANNFTEDSTSSGATVGVFDVDDEETADGSLTVTVSDTTNYAISYDNSGTATVTLTDAGAARVNAGNELPAYTVTVTDGDSSTATATHDPSVTTVNDDPTIAVSATSTLTEGSVSAGDTVHTFNIADEETADDTLTLTLSNTTYYAVANNDNGTATVTLTDLNK